MKKLPWTISKSEPLAIFLSACVLLITAFFSVGFYHADEHFQVLEFAGYKLGLTPLKDLPWEFHFRMRPALQPAMAVLLHHFFSLFGIENPFAITLILRILSAGISLTGMWLVYKAFYKTIESRILGQWFLLLSFFLWFAIYNHVRFSSENWSGTLFVIAFAFYVIRKKPGRLFFFSVGVLTGLSFLFRY